jgi:hypothetical protein
VADRPRRAARTDAHAAPKRLRNPKVPPQKFAIIIIPVAELNDPEEATIDALDTTPSERVCSFEPTEEDPDKAKTLLLARSQETIDIAED